MKDILNKVKEIKSEACITIALNTHRTKPDYLKDEIVLKNLVKEAEQRISTIKDSNKAKAINDNLKNLVNRIDFSTNLESLSLFVNENTAEFVSLPINVENRVVLDNSFAIRDLYRALHEQTGYYILVLSRENAKLIEAYNDKVITEIKNNFPIENDSLYTTSKHKLTMARGQDNYIEEFFHRVDKALNSFLGTRNAPIVVATEERNYHHYLKVAQKKELILAHLNKNRDNEKLHHIVSEAWPLLNSAIKERQQERISELKKAENNGNFFTEINDIWRAVQEGRGRTLFVKKGFFQAALVNGNSIEVVPNERSKELEVKDDIIGEIVELNAANGGECVFIENDELKEYDNIALITRY